MQPLIDFQRMSNCAFVCLWTDNTGNMGFHLDTRGCWVSVSPHSISMCVLPNTRLVTNAAWALIHIQNKVDSNSLACNVSCTNTAAVCSALCLLREAGQAKPFYVTWRAEDLWLRSTAGLQKCGCWRHVCHEGTAVAQCIRTSPAAGEPVTGWRSAH